MSQPPQPRATLIDLFAGCGGGSIGFAKAGLTPVGAVEIDAEAATAYEANVSLRPVVRDIRRVDGADLLGSANLKAGECTLLFGCPPCQSYTILRKGAKSTRRDRLRNSLYRDYLRLAESIMPRHIAFENVPGMLSPRWRPRFDALLDGLEDLGYAYEWALLDAADFGVPQRRKRILVIASRMTAPVLPTPTHAEKPAGRLRAHATVRSVIGSLPVVRSGEADPGDPYHRARRHSELALRRLRAVPEGGGRADLPEELQLECHKEHDGHYDIYGRMWWDRPAPTLTSGCTNVTRGRFAHPEQDRAITLREALMLQSFPRWAELRGTFEQMALQVGNAIPPLLAQRIGETIMAMEASARTLAGDQAGDPPPTSTRRPARSRASKTLVSSST
jgi:DNA (cytosine-5)-methyltransferase 1